MPSQRARETVGYPPAMDSPDGQPGATPGSTASATWEFLEIVAAVILAAESLRVIGSVVSGIIDGATTHVGVFNQRQLVGGAMERAANFSDGPGIVLLLISLALLWGRAEYWTSRIDLSTGSAGSGDLPAEAVQARRLATLARWMSWLFVLAALGAVAFLAGDILVTTSSGASTSHQAQAYANDAFT